MYEVEMKKVIRMFVGLTLILFTAVPTQYYAKPYYCTKALLDCTDKCAKTFILPNGVAWCAVGCLIGYDSCGE
jgi:hypothetical protein